MKNLFKKIFGPPKVNLQELSANGAIIIDVRTPGEFKSGHVERSVNIPLDQISSGIKKLKNKEQVIITCCASGMRSGAAKNILKSQGYANVYNGGSWKNLI